jgi:hypothetical protein
MNYIKTKNKISFTFLVLLGALFFLTSNVSAQENGNIIPKPTFPKCSTPQGQTVVYHITGVHGIPGDSGTYTGSDEVFRLTEDTLTQCFCSINDDGIQSNWWKVSSLTIDEVEELVALGWVYIPNGALWGLDEAPYMVQNTRYDCDPEDPKDDDDDDDDDKDDNDEDDDDDERIGSILGMSDQRFGQVLGLATTGNLVLIALLSTISGYFFALALFLIKKARRI